MPFEILKHTADLRLHIRGRTLPELFSHALHGLMHIMKPQPPQRETIVKRVVILEALDQTALLVDFLNKVLAEAQIHREVYKNVVFPEFQKTSLRAELHGVPIDAFDEDVKAVTYHEAEVRQNKRGEWETMLVLDI